MAIFSGNAHPALAHDIARSLMLPLARAHVGRFSDGELSVEILENIRGRETFIVQPTCPPASENLMELLVMVDAAKRASASRITAVIPYFGFARQDRRPRASRVPITAKLVAKLIAAAGVDRVLTVDLHADQIQGFFDIAVDNVYASPILLGDVWKHRYPDMVAKRLDDSDLVIIDKRRQKANQSEVMNIIGECKNKTCIMMDDMVDTAGTLCQAAGALKDHGAKAVHAYITHPVLSGPAVSRIADSSLDTIVVTDTIPLSAEAQACEKIRQLSTAELLAETVRRIADEESVSSLYVD
jgi:ribose-phosphate pyrophosphokinase